MVSLAADHQTHMRARCTRETLLVVEDRVAGRIDSAVRLVSEVREIDHFILRQSDDQRMIVAVRDLEAPVQLTIVGFAADVQIQRIGLNAGQILVSASAIGQIRVDLIVAKGRDVGQPYAAFDVDPLHVPFVLAAGIVVACGRHCDGAENVCDVDHDARCSQLGRRLNHRPECFNGENHIRGDLLVADDYAVLRVSGGGEDDYRQETDDDCDELEFLHCECPFW